MRRSTWSLSTSISRMPAMRFRRSSGEMISSRFCFSSTPTSRWAAIVSASLPGSSTRTALIIASYCRLFDSLTYCSNSETTRPIVASVSLDASFCFGSTLTTTR
ncbi:hypothetical protein D3C83_10230 [compost metagenome]